ncbi:hypothetical protein Taro_019094 [Colocasia esculenta]|uniref:KIB1-4 beta-propeller domain-containing protein n=1 Tax=Colocasia esculenta TaxID=4460 RepID=A0A843UVQ7_COLES|nr:hypothetical protein [Colocasia esculenta]
MPWQAASSCSGASMASPKQARADWSRLPEAVVDLVARRTTNNGDYVRLRAVCTAWRSATPARPSHLPRQLPWLVLPSPDASGVLRFFSLPDGKTHSVQMPPGSGGSHCCGSSSGWSRADNLLGATPVASSRSNQLGSPLAEQNMPGEFFLLNPLTRERIQLPPLDTREVLQSMALEPGGGYVVRGRPGPDFSCNLEYIRRHLVSRFVLSSDPASGDCVAMASLCHGAIFAFCRPGRDSSWTTLTAGPFSSFQDIVFNGGRFYAVDTRLVLYVCDVGPPSRIQEFSCSSGDREQCAVLERRRRRQGQVIERAYLVESCGDLLMVLKTCDDVLATLSAGEEENEHRPIPDFEVYKLDASDRGRRRGLPRWVELESLGGGALFLGPGHSLSLPAGDTMGGCPGNCIYFSDHRSRKQDGAVHGGPGFGVFHLGDGHVERVLCSPVDPGSIWQPSLWISPSLRGASPCWE